METKPIQCAWVIDDDPLQVLVLNRLLTGHNAVQKTRFFSGAKAAIESLVEVKNSKNDLPDVVFLDLVMQRGDGWDFLDQYKKMKSKLARQTRIVVISSFTEENIKRIQQYSDVVRSLSKPVDKKEFEETLNFLIDLASPR